MKIEVRNSPAILAIALLFLACTLWPSCITAQEHPDEHYHASRKLELELNEGKKWQADSHTINLVARMNEILNQYEKTGEDKSLIRLKSLGTDLKKNLNELVRGCTMTGAAHNQLHIWISLISPDIDQLVHANDLNQANDAYEQIRLRLNQFSERFILAD